MIPYIQLHEFEALLFAAPEKFAAAYPNRLDKVQQLIKIRSQFKPFCRNTKKRRQVL
ncbi:MAG: DUF4276 family protein [Pseudomonadota bacterium]